MVARPPSALGLSIDLRVSDEWQETATSDKRREKRSGVTTLRYAPDGGVGMSGKEKRWAWRTGEEHMRRAAGWIRIATAATLLVCLPSVARADTVLGSGVLQILGVGAARLEIDAPPEVPI